MSDRVGGVNRRGWMCCLRVVSWLWLMGVLGALSTLRGAELTQGRVTQVGRWPSFKRHYSAELALQGCYAYIADLDGGLQVVDVSDPANLLHVGHCPSLGEFPDLSAGTTGGYAYDVELGDEFAYVAHGRAGLAVYSLLAPARPLLSWHLEGLADARALALAEGLLLVVSVEGKAGRLHLLDLGEPGQPEWAGAVGLGAAPNDVVSSGRYGYVATDAGIEIVDLADPYAPVTVRRRSASWAVRALHLGGDLLYEGRLYPGLTISDITDPLQPIELGGSSLGSVFDVTVVGQRALVAGVMGMGVLDVSNPATPLLLGHLPPDGSAYGSGAVSVSDTTAFVADSYTLMHAVDLADPTNPIRLATCTTPTSDVVAVAGAGERVYVANSDHGLELLDITDISRPVKLGNYGDRKRVHDVTVVGSQVCVVEAASANDSYLRMLDVSNPSHPVVTGSAGPFRVKGLLAAGPQLRVASDRLRILDASGPGNPVEIGGYRGEGSPVALDGAGQYVYLVGTAGQLEVVDLQMPASPLLVGTVALGELPAGICAQDGYAYVTGHELGLLIFDVKDPSSPVLVGSWVGEAVGYSGVAVRDGYAFVTCAARPAEGLLVIDVHDVGHPRRAGHFATGGFAAVVEQHDQGILIASGLGGLEIVDWTEPLKLTVRSRGEGILEVEWPEKRVGAELLRTDDVVMGDWQGVGGSTGTNRIAVPMTGARECFRLYEVEQPTP